VLILLTLFYVQDGAHNIILVYLSSLYCHLEKEFGRVKTREELLAEERDYKRRRTSYRGKKAKRNPKEVRLDLFLKNIICLYHPQVF
jgi:hypothetical protein